MKNAKIIKKEVVVNKFGKKMVKETLKVDNETTLDWYYLDTPKSIVVIPITRKNELVLVKIYRHNLKKHVYELPAGSFDETEKEVSEVARRELFEETGYTTEKMIDLGKYYNLPSETNRWVHIVLALDVVKIGKPKLDNIIEKYFDMSVVTRNFVKTIENLGESKSLIHGIEHCFALTLAQKFLEKRKI